MHFQNMFRGLLRVFCELPVDTCCCLNVSPWCWWCLVGEMISGSSLFGRNSRVVVAWAHNTGHRSHRLFSKGIRRFWSSTHAWAQLWYWLILKSMKPSLGAHEMDSALSFHLMNVSITVHSFFQNCSIIEASVKLAFGFFFHGYYHVILILSLKAKKAE